MQSAAIPAPKGSFGVSMKGPKKWTMASDHKSDMTHGIKEGSAKDMKLDASRGLKDTLAKLGGK
jgi:hypothetical protein